MSPTRAAALFLACVAAACAPPASSAQPGRGVLVVAVDALRADHVSALGYDRSTTPAIDRLAEQGAIFTDVWSASPDVLPAHAALLTGCDPGLAQRPGLAASGPASDLNRWLVPPGLPSLAQEFLAAGFDTAGFADHPAVAPIRGVAKGFQMFGGFREDALDPDLELGFEGVATRFVRWLNERSGNADWFAYLHVNDLERVWTRPPADARFGTTYEPRPELSAMPPVAEGDHAWFAVPRPRWAGVPRTLGEYEVRYDGAINLLDLKLGRLLEKLRRSGRLENTTVVVVGTFGMSFGEGGLYLDTGALTAADLRVPLVVRPGADVEMRRGLRVDSLASLVDLAPTLLELHGLRVPAGMTGASHARGLLAPGSPPPRSIVYSAGGFQRGIAAIDAHWLVAREHPSDAAVDLMVRTWYGGDAPPGDGAVERVVARGDSGPEGEDTARARLVPALDAWSEWIERARPILHGRAPASSDPSAAADLRRRGLLEAPR